MATSPRTVLFALALGFSAVLLSVGPAGATAVRAGQDPGPATFGGAGATSTTIVASSTATTAVDATQTLVEQSDPPATRPVTESRKVMAVIGGLVLVAVALLILTIRYWIVTRPVAGAAVEDPPTSGPPAVPGASGTDDDPEVYEIVFVDKEAGVTATDAPADDDIWLGGLVPSPATMVDAADGPVEVGEVIADAPSDGPDHVGADSDWEPHTGEHERVEAPVGARLARPTAEARRRALGLSETP